MRSFRLIVRQEYVSKLRSGGYIAATLLMILMIVTATVVPALLEGAGDKPMRVLLLDRTGAVAGPLQELIKNSPRPEGARDIHIEEVTGDLAPHEARARDGQVGLMVVEGLYPSAVKARFLSGDVRVLSDSHLVGEPLNNLVRQARLKERGLDPAIALEVLRPVEAEVRHLTEKDGERDANAVGGSFMLAMSALMAIFIIVLMNSNYVFQGVLEEKVSRVVEVMAATVRPSVMLAGKVAGLGALGLTQFVLLVIAWKIGTEMAGSFSQIKQPPVEFGVGLLILLYLVLNFALNAAMMAAGAAMISRMEDQQSTLMPLTMLSSLPMLFLSIVMFEPNGTFGTVISLIPFFSPIMLMRVILTDVPPWQIAFSIVLLLVTTAVVIWAAGRIYRAAMLRYGTRPSFRQVLGYLRMG